MQKIWYSSQIIINSYKHNFFLTKYKDVCKSDQEVIHSENPPPWLLSVASPKTNKSIAGFSTTCATIRKFTEGEYSHGVAKKRESLTNLDLSEFIREMGIKTYTEFLAVAAERRTAGQMDIAEFVYKRNEKTCYQNLANGASVVIASGYCVPKRFFCSIELTASSLLPILKIY